MSIKNVEKSAAGPLLKDGSLALHVGAAPEIPKPLIDQLKPGGRLVIPVGNTFQELKVVDKNEDGSVKMCTETSVRYVPLTSREAQLRGY
ncbi:putative protein-L-isoaspartate(D-aspartate) O-methyltransferase [Helianthus debilis subsp. tardiflorus]